jgi:hypothetical protein
MAVVCENMRMPQLEKLWDIPTTDNCSVYSMGFKLFSFLNFEDNFFSTVILCCNSVEFECVTLIYTQPLLILLTLS